MARETVMVAWYIRSSLHRRVILRSTLYTPPGREVMYTMLLSGYLLPSEM